ncbi:hypothetical protein KR018_002189 [Drosophila ironensis]|nr:hypothetical protein KR018_002189 [Drosophila ironensis]
MNGLSCKLIGCQIKIALVVGLLVSLAWSLPVENSETLTSVEGGSADAEEFVEGVPVIEETSSVGQLRFPPFNNNGTGFFERFGEKFRNKWTSSTTTTTTTKAPPPN